MHFAQMTFDPAALLNLGVAGVVLWWFMSRLETRLKDQAGAMDRMSRAILVSVVTLERLAEPERKRVNAILEELDEAEKIRTRGL